MKLEEIAKFFALKNAHEHNGKANPGSVIGSVISEIPEIKKDMNSNLPIIKDIVKEVNSMSKKKIKEDYNKIVKSFPELVEDEDDNSKKELKDLENVSEKGVVMRFAPSASGPMHLGHAFTGGITSLYVKKYGGEFILRIEDTNPDNIYPKAYKMLEDDADWIFGNVTEVIIQSERMELYYEYIEKLINLKSAYVCTCEPETFREYVKDQKDCPCRSNSKRKNKKRWKKMLDKTGYSEGDAVIRFKSDMKHKNPAMRDFPLARICNTPHAKQGVKYRVWPLMNLSVTVDDIESGMTHIIRAKDHQTNSKRQKLIYDSLGLSDDFPEVYFTGRLKFEDLDLSTSKTRKLIDEGKYDGWDDVRLPTLKSLKKRGYQSETFHELIKEFGLSNVDKVFSRESFFKTLNKVNRKIIDDKTYRFTFLEDPVSINIENIPSKNEIKIQLHPDIENKYKTFNLREDFLLKEEVVEEIKENKNYLYRMKDAFNFFYDGEIFKFHSFDFEEYKKSENKGGVIQFIPKHLGAKSKVIKPSEDGSEKVVISGYAENKVIKFDSEMVRFEKFGFCRFVKKAHHELIFYYTHD